MNIETMFRERVIPNIPIYLTWNEPQQNQGDEYEKNIDNQVLEIFVGVHIPMPSNSAE